MFHSSTYKVRLKFRVNEYVTANQLVATVVGRDLDSKESGLRDKLPDLLPETLQQGAVGTQEDFHHLVLD